MNFENFLSQKIFELRHELNKMTNEHPELKPHFGLSHAGLLDNETEKLVVVKYVSEGISEDEIKAKIVK